MLGLRDGKTDLTRAIKNIQAERFNKSATGSQHYVFESKAEYIAKKDRDLINMPNAQGKTPLMVAYLLGEEKLSAYLLRKGVDVNAQDHDGKTLLAQVVTSHRKSSSGEFLLACGADPTIKDLQGKSALDYGQANFERFCCYNSNPRCGDAHKTKNMLMEAAQKPGAAFISQYKNH